MLPLADSSCDDWNESVSETLDFIDILSEDAMPKDNEVTNECMGPESTANEEIGSADVATEMPDKFPGVQGPIVSPANVKITSPEDVTLPEDTEIRNEVDDEYMH